MAKVLRSSTLVLFLCRRYSAHVGPTNMHIGHSRNESRKFLVFMDLFVCTTSEHFLEESESLPWPRTRKPASPSLYIMLSYWTVIIDIHPCPDDVGSCIISMAELPSFKFSLHMYPADIQIPGCQAHKTIATEIEDGVRIILWTRVNM